MLRGEREGNVKERDELQHWENDCGDEPSSTKTEFRVKEGEGGLLVY